MFITIKLIILYIRFKIFLKKKFVINILVKININQNKKI
ncbi:conserved hypothetical protein (plasmid) [Borreliella burgdorferi 94a]|nr:conserved hypothetical protein [Borreliella burgdorferi 94a]